MSCYQPIIEEMIKYYPDAKSRNPKYRVLLPGAGLGFFLYIEILFSGRLVFDLASKGFCA